MSEELIRRSDAIKALKDNMVEMGGEDFSEIGVHSDDIDAIINDIPTIEPKRGKWIPVKASIYPYGNDVKCSVCGHRMGSSFGYNFCPMCGADMREREGE